MNESEKLAKFKFLEFQFLDDRVTIFVKDVYC